MSEHRQPEEATAEISEGDHLYGAARDMQSACCALLERNRAKDENRFTSSLHFLMGFSIELYLKAALAHVLVPTSQRHGHDLEKLLLLAETKGLLQFVNLEPLRKLVTFIAPGHRDFSFRYPKPGSTITIVTTMSEALTVLQTLDDHIRRNVDVAAATILCES